MFKSNVFIKLLTLVILTMTYTATATALPKSFSKSDSKSVAIRRADSLLQTVRDNSFPELKDTDIRVRLLNSKSDFFRTRFSITRYLFCVKMRFYIEVNPEVFDLQAPEEGLRAIIAHELGHVLYMLERNRIKLLSLVRLASKNYTARFERRTDLETISRGYAKGLIEYRNWLYQNISAANVEKKKRDYFSPEEISAITESLKKRPELFAYWMKHIPLNLEGIKAQTGNSILQKHHL